ncbi:MAG TPA: S53 family peptidase, partial [Opitutaceae bacterium]|nr:S53 family peptidase [Opitutaceae bacterium]
DSVQMPYFSRNARVARWTLDPQELGAFMDFCVTLKMRNFADLQTRLGRGEKISRDELEANYLPPAAAYAAVQDWLVSQGFTVTLVDPNHANVFARGTVEQVRNAFQTVFAKVATSDGEFTSAVTPPSLPAEFSGAVLGVMGLQPHMRMHAKLPALATHPHVVTIGARQYLGPGDMMAAYNAPSTLSGAGQTIAIIIDATVSNSDLQTFYSTVGSSQTVSNITTILVNGGPTPTSQSNDGGEAALDVEWASGMAPGAKIRLYATHDLGVSLQTAINMILSDAPANNITVVAMSFGAPESQPASLTSFSQNFALLAAANITAICSSGDGGSNPNPSSPGDYGTGNALLCEYPASDPNVTGIGGTLITLSPFTSTYVGESVFSTIHSGSGFASGGGVSTVFGRPAWQTDGGSVLGGNSMRCVPDVAVIWEGVTTGGQFEPALMIQNGSAQGVGGTSLSCQIWAGIAALLNQARANAGMGPIGVLGPAIYPLHGTSAFNDITMGNNGAYSAGPGYDLCTGLGSPNIANLAAALAGTPSSQNSGGSTPPASAAAGSSGGGGGGGGAPSLWFYAALAVLAALRHAVWRRRPVS